MFHLDDFEEDRNHHDLSNDEENAHEPEGLLLQSSDSSSNLPFQESLFISSHGSVVVDGQTTITILMRVKFERNCTINQLAMPSSILTLTGYTILLPKLEKKNLKRIEGAK